MTLLVPKLTGSSVVNAHLDTAMCMDNQTYLQLLLPNNSTPENASHLSTPRYTHEGTSCRASSDHCI